MKNLKTYIKLVLEEKEINSKEENKEALVADLLDMFENKIKKEKDWSINYEKNMTKSTKNNLKWWGDAVSKNFLSGVNKSHKITIDENFFDL